MKKTKPYIVTSRKQLLAIASPGREEIIDVLGLLGPSSVPELAEFLGRSRHALYYHVRALRDCGVLIETLHSGEGKKTTARYDLAGHPLIVQFDLSSPQSRRAVLALARTRVRHGLRGFVRAASSDAAVTEGARRNLWATHWKGWLSGAELEEFNEHLKRLVELLQREPGPKQARRKAHEVTFVLAPVLARK